MQYQPSDAKNSYPSAQNDSNPYGDGDIPEIDLPASDNASPDIPLEFPGKKRQARSSISSF